MSEIEPVATKDEQGAAALSETERKQRSLANLRPFQPGESGNPGGRPKGTSITSAILKVLAEEGAMEAFAAALVKEAQKGNGAIAKEILGRVDGPLKQEMDLNHKMDLSTFSESELRGIQDGLLHVVVIDGQPRCVPV